MKTITAIGMALIIAMLISGCDLFPNTPENRGNNPLRRFFAPKTTPGPTVTLVPTLTPTPIQTLTQTPTPTPTPMVTLSPVISPAPRLTPVR